MSVDGSKTTCRRPPAASTSEPTIRPSDRASCHSKRVEPGSSAMSSGRIPLEELFGGGWQRIPDRDGTWSSTRAAAAPGDPGGFQGLLWFGPGAAPEFEVAPALRWGLRVWGFNGVGIDSTAYCYVPLADAGATAVVAEPPARVITR